MRVTEETADRLVIEMPPRVGYWFSACGTAAGVVMIAATLLAGEFEDDVDRVLSGAAGVVAVLISGVVAAAQATLTVTLDRPTNTARVERRGWWSESAEELPLTEVAAAELETTLDSDGGTLYRVALRLAGGRTLPFGLCYDMRVRPKQTVVEAINRFLCVPHPAG
jgi:hypothetical protein